jgi:hypothetical protein
VQRRAPLLVARVGLSAARQQLAQHYVIPLDGHDVERRPPLGGVGLVDALRLLLHRDAQLGDVALHRRLVDGGHRVAHAGKGGLLLCGSAARCFDVALLLGPLEERG